RQCCAGSPAIIGCLTPATSGPSPRSVARREPRTTTDGYELAARAISRRCAPSPTAWLASLTAASAIVSCTERRWPGHYSKLPLDFLRTWDVSPDWARLGEG